MKKTQKQFGNGSTLHDSSMLEEVFERYDVADYKWIDPKKIEIAEWVRVKCMFGCARYARCACCPPNVPSVSECLQFFREYDDAVVFHFEKKLNRPDDRYPWSVKVNRTLLDMEKEVFLLGYPRTFLLFMNRCQICDECAGVRENCSDPRSARPTPEAFGVDVFSTVKQYGYPIHVLTDYSQLMNRYAFLLIH